MTKSRLPTPMMLVLLTLAVGISFSGLAEDSKGSDEPVEGNVAQAVIIGDYRIEKAPETSNLCAFACSNGDTFEADVSDWPCVCVCAIVCDEECTGPGGLDGVDSCSPSEL